MTEWEQVTFRMPAVPRGFHLVTRDIESRVPALAAFRIGLAHIFIHHTSASLTLNENADPTVRDDFETHMNRLIPESANYAHDYEGPDDMPAHLKAALLGNHLSIPVRDGRLHMGTWQGIYLCEHRNQAPPRQLTVTICGTKA